MPVLAMVDVVGIQSFVFSSNRLKNVDGGSSLVRKATSAGPESWIAALGHGAQALVGAGGNLLLRFDSLEDAKILASRFSRYMLTHAPGLEAAVEYCRYEPGGLAGAVKKVQALIQDKKGRRAPNVPLLNLGVAEACYETGLAAANFDQDDHPVAEAVQIRNKAGEASSLWKELLPENPVCDGLDGCVEVDFPADLDQMGRSHGDTSLVGIVHVDGYGTGRLLGKWLDRFIAQGRSDEDFAKAYGQMSAGIDANIKGVVRHLLGRVRSAITWDEEEGSHMLRGTNGKFRLYREGSTLYLPIRPLVTAGEDITFICDGRIALDLAASALREFANSEIPGIGRLSACAGVNVVRTHTPIIKAYALAESLCTNAKQRVRTLEQEGELRLERRSAIDWHIGTMGVTETLADLRARQYEQSRLPLTLRPYVRGSHAAKETGTWHWFVDEMLLGPNGFQNEFWKRHRSKAKELRGLVRRGPNEVKDAFDRWAVSLSSNVDLPPGLPNGGFLANIPGENRERTPLLDAIELADLYLSLGSEAS